MKSNARIAELLVRLMTGETLNQVELQKQYAIGLRTCQRDLSAVRQALTVYEAGELIERAGTYRFQRQSADRDFEMILATSNILLGTRALMPEELTATLDFLSAGLSPLAQATLRKQLTISRGSYTPLSRPTPLLRQLRRIAGAIVHNEKLVFSYQSSESEAATPSNHHAQPVAVFFETYYFYVAMLSQEHHGYWLYRLDRIVNILKQSPGDKLNYAERFSLQDHRHQTYLLDSGSLTQVRFIYRNYSQTVLDHFPGAKVLRTNADGSLLIEAYIKVDGAILWLLSQGAGLQVVSPPSLVARMQRELTAALNQYQTPQPGDEK